MELILDLSGSASKQARDLQEALFEQGLGHPPSNFPQLVNDIISPPDTEHLNGVAGLSHSRPVNNFGTSFEPGPQAKLGKLADGLAAFTEGGSIGSGRGRSVAGKVGAGASLLGFLDSSVYAHMMGGVGYTGYDPRNPPRSGESNQTVGSGARDN